MRAVLHTGVAAPWCQPAGGLPWILLPFGNRPLLEFWLEWCVELGISDIRLVLDEGAKQIEDYAGDGERWGLCLSYSFQRDQSDPVAFFRRAPQHWLEEGLLHLRTPAFPRRLGNAPAPAAGDSWVAGDGEGVGCVLSRDPDFLADYLAGGDPAAGRAFALPGRELLPLRSLCDFYQLNMRLVRGEMADYLRPGYYYQDNVSIGYNVTTPPTAGLIPPLIIGNNCRVSPLTSIGPDAVVGNHVIIDRRCELSGCVILDGTYVGRGMELREKIVAGNTVIDPHSGAVVAVADAFMLSSVESRSRLGGLLQDLVSRLVALLLVLSQFIPFALLIGGKLASGSSFVQQQVGGKGGRRLRLPLFLPANADSLANRLFLALALDRHPQFWLAASGALWLCGNRPQAVSPEAEGPEVPFPAVLSYADLRAESDDPDLCRAEVNYYHHHRSFIEDVRIVKRFIQRRWAALLPEAKSGATADGRQAGDE